MDAIVFGPPAPQCVCKSCGIGVAKRMGTWIHIEPSDGQHKVEPKRIND